MELLLLLAVILVGNVLLVALFLWLGAHWVKAPKASFLRAFLVAVVLGVLGFLLLPVAMRFQEAAGQQGVIAILVLALLFGQALVSWLVIRSSFQTTFLRAIGVWAVGLIGGIAGLGFVFAIVKPYVMEAFIVPTNAMAPTVLGWHETSVCPRCQGLFIVPAQPPDEPRNAAFEQDQVGICTSCLKASMVKASGSSVEPPDRIMVNKLLAPRRWDMIAFRYPIDPMVKYMKRLVGLPGETVYVKEGTIWVNEVQVQPPTELAGLRYVSASEQVGLGNLGTPDNPWLLEHDQYCVLGDFSERSSDSRSWGPVPGANIEGVVSLCYWPIARWRVFR